MFYTYFCSAFKGLSNDIHLEDVTDWKIFPTEFNVLCFALNRTGNEKFKKKNSRLFKIFDPLRIRFRKKISFLRRKFFGINQDVSKQSAISFA